MFRCIVIDDEPHAIAGLKKYIESIPELIFLKSYTDPVLALREISNSDPVDIIFMDVDMPTITGIELSKVLRAKTDNLIFTTAHTKYAYEAFESSANAYLLKPYSLGKFTITINKLLHDKLRNDVEAEQRNKEEDDFFFVKSKNDDLKILRIRYTDIVVVESKLNYIMIHTTTKQVITYMSLSEIGKKLLSRSGFLQLHRSFIVNTNAIETISANLVKMINGFQLTVGDFYRKEFKDYVANGLIKAGDRK